MYIFVKMQMSSCLLNVFIVVGIDIIIVILHELMKVVSVQHTVKIRYKTLHQLSIVILIIFRNLI